MDVGDQERAEWKARGIGLFRYDDGPVHSYPYDEPWMTDEEFSSVYDVIRHNTLVDRNRCYALYLIARQVQDVCGDVLEVGTWRGGTAGILTSALRDRMVYLADTFEGVVKASAWEHYQDRAHSDTSIPVVTELLGKRLTTSNFTILKGIFPEESADAIADKRFALVYLDLDVYRSTKDAFDWAWERVSTSGIVVFDDYGFTSACPGIKKFVDEIQGDADKIFLQNMNGQAYIIKKTPTL